MLVVAVLLRLRPPVQGHLRAAEDYAAAVDNQPLQVPAGLQGPDTRSALPVPPLAEPERPRRADEPCLDAPPRYANPAPVRPAA